MHCTVVLITRMSKNDYELISCRRVAVLLVCPQHPDSVEDVGGIPSILSGRKFTTYQYFVDAIVRMCGLCIVYCCLTCYLNHTWYKHDLLTWAKMLLSLCPALAVCRLALLTVPVEARHCEATVLLNGALPPSTEVLYHEGDVGQDCLCLKVPRSQGDPSTAISLGSMEVTWRRE